MAERLSTTVARAQREVSYAEFVEWQAYDSVVLPETIRQDVRIAKLTALIANVNRKKGTKPFSPKDFAIDFKVKAPQTYKEMKKNVMAWMGVIKKKGKK